MRVLVLENQPTSLRGGQDFSLLDICRGLAAGGHDVELLYTRPGDLLAEYDTFCRRIDQVSAYAVDRRRTLRSAAQLAADLVQRRRTVPDVIYANQYLDSLFGRLLGWRFQRPFVCHVRLRPPDIFCEQYRWGMRGTARLIATSNQTREDYVARGFRRDRIDVVYNGIAPEAWQPTITRAEARARLDLDPRAFLIAYAGRFHPDKGLQVLINALPLLRDHAQVVMAGREIPDGRKDVYEDQLKEQARTLGVAGRCRWVGHLSRAAELYRAADVVVLPSTSSEAFGRTIIESMACGTPAVGSRIGGIPEILTGEFAEFLFPAGDHRALACRLNALDGWADKDPGLAGRCRSHVCQHFDVVRTIDGTESSLERTVAEWRGGARPHAAGDILRTPRPCASA